MNASQKARDRRKRMSLDEAPHIAKTNDNSFYPTKMDASPEIKARQKQKDQKKQDFPMASTISAIYKSSYGERDSNQSGIMRYGSVEKSDGDLYNVLSRGHAEHGKRRTASSYQSMDSFLESSSDNYSPPQRSTGYRPSGMKDEPELSDFSDDDEDDEMASSQSSSKGSGKKRGGGGTLGKRTSTIPAILPNRSLNSVTSGSRSLLGESHEGGDEEDADSFDDNDSGDSELAQSRGLEGESMQDSELSKLASQQSTARQVQQAVKRQQRYGQQPRHPPQQLAAQSQQQQHPHRVPQGKPADGAALKSNPASNRRYSQPSGNREAAAGGSAEAQHHRGTNAGDGDEESGEMAGDDDYSFDAFEKTPDKPKYVKATKSVPRSDLKSATTSMVPPGSGSSTFQRRASTGSPAAASFSATVPTATSSAAAKGLLSAPSPVPDEKEMERRKSLEMIMQRWKIQDAGSDTESKEGAKRVSTALQPTSAETLQPFVESTVGIAEAKSSSTLEFAAPAKVGESQVLGQPSSADAKDGIKPVLTSHSPAIVEMKQETATNEASNGEPSHEEKSEEDLYGEPFEEDDEEFERMIRERQENDNSDGENESQDQTVPQERHLNISDNDEVMNYSISASRQNDDEEKEGFNDPEIVGISSQIIKAGSVTSKPPTPALAATSISPRLNAGSVPNPSPAAFNNQPSSTSASPSVVMAPFSSTVLKAFPSAIEREPTPALEIDGASIHGPRSGGEEPPLPAMRQSSISPNLTMVSVPTAFSGPSRSVAEIERQATTSERAVFATSAPTMTRHHTFSSVMPGRSDVAADAPTERTRSASVPVSATPDIRPNLTPLVLAPQLPEARPQDDPVRGSRNVVRMSGGAAARYEQYENSDNESISNGGGNRSIGVRDAATAVSASTGRRAYSLPDSENNVPTADEIQFRAIHSVVPAPQSAVPMSIEGQSAQLYSQYHGPKPPLEAPAKSIEVRRTSTQSLEKEARVSAVYRSGSSLVPFSTELDPSVAQFLENEARRSTARKHQENAAAADRRRSAERLGTWPSELPFTAPNVAELHAHISLLNASHQRNQVRQMQSKKEPELKYRNVTSKSQQSSTGATPSSIPRRVGSHSARSKLKDLQFHAQAASSSIQQLADRNARFEKQFQALEEEIHQVRGSRGESELSKLREKMTRGEATSLLVDSAEGLHTLRGSRTSRSQSAPISRRTSLPSKTGSAVGTTNAPAVNSPSEAARSMVFGANNLWDDEAKNSFQHILEKDALLSVKERELQKREKALEVRESFANSLVKKASDAAFNRTQQLAADEEQQKISEQQKGEIASLKAQLFDERQRMQGHPPSSLVGDGTPNEVSKVSPKVTFRHRSRPTEGRRLSVGAQRSPQKRLSDHASAEQKIEGAEGKANVDGNDGSVEAVVDLETYNKLLAECQSQEVLITGFQKENEKLLAQLRQRESEDKLLKAKFFDQQEDLNKELNRLRNATGAGDSESLEQTLKPTNGHRRSAEELREELERDALIQSLRERVAVAESNAGAKQKELQQTIEKLRKENRELIESARHQRNQIIAEIGGNYKDLEAAKGRLEKEVKDLKARLVWFAENQELIEAVESEKDRWKASTAVLQKALLRQGMSKATVESLIARAAESPSSVNVNWDDGTRQSDDPQNTSTRSSLGVKSKARNPADVKRIRELENTVKELHDCLQKRNPNSLASLIQAASTSESVQLERKHQQESVEAAKRELEEAKIGFERRLRSLRQEHERLRLQYEDKGKFTEESLQDNSFDKLLNQQDIPAQSNSASEKSSTPPNARIRELEADLQRVRAFYTKKIEDLVKRHENQIHALNRGNVVPVAAPSTESSAAAQMNAQFGGREHILTEQVSCLEKELLETAEELGRAKKEIAELKTKLTASEEKYGQALAASNAASIHPYSAPQKSDEDISAEINRRVETTLAAQFAHWQSLVASKESASFSAAEELARVRSEYAEAKSSLQSQLQSVMNQRDDMWNRLREEEARAAHLVNEITELKITIGRLQTPQMLQFQATEKNIKQLEQRIEQREAALTSSIAETKAANKLERARLQALHEQEMREKDAQIYQMRSELQSIVATLRGWQSAVPVGT